MRPVAAAFGILMFFVASSAAGQGWVEGEMGYRITVVPEGSPGARHGLRIGDILAEPGPLPGRLVASGQAGVEIPLYRHDPAKARYEKAAVKIVFLAGEEKRLGLTGDLGFLVTAARPGSLGARAELQPGDFIPKIDETFVHGEKDLRLVDEAFEKGEEVLIHFTRWVPDAREFKNGVSRRTFLKQVAPASQTDKAARPRPLAALVESRMLDDCIGHYEIDEQRLFAVRRKDGVLKGRAASGPELELIPRSGTEFIWFNPDSAVDAEVVFVRDDSGRVTHAVLRRGGRDVWRAARVQ